LRLREQHRQFAAVAPSPWHSESLTHLHAKLAEFNEAYFGGQLKTPYLALGAPGSARRMGEFAPVSGFGGNSAITIRKSILDGTWKNVRSGGDHQAGRLLVVEDILLHELIHLFHHEVTGCTEDTQNGHGRAFRNECNRIGALLGLPPVRSQRTSGKDKELPSCSHWPHDVRPRDPDYFLGAYIWNDEDRTPDEAEDDASDVDAAQVAYQKALKELEETAIAIGTLRAILDGPADEFRREFPDAYPHGLAILEEHAHALFRARCAIQTPSRVTNIGDADADAAVSDTGSPGIERESVENVTIDGDTPNPIRCDEPVRSGGRAVVVVCDAVMGRSEIPVRSFSVSEPTINDRGNQQVRVSGFKPRMRTATYWLVEDDGKHTRYVTVEVDGVSVYDSRADVPCDMAAWDATNQHHANDRPLVMEQAT